MRADRSDICHTAPESTLELRHMRTAEEHFKSDQLHDKLRLI